MNRLVIGIGNELRGDDAAGLLAARAVRAAAPAAFRIRESRGDPGDLMALWRDMQNVYMIDCCVSGSVPGTIRRFDSALGPLPARFDAVSSHGFGLAAALELARALRRLPPRLIVFGIEGDCFEIGAPPSPAIAEAASRVAERIMRQGRCPDAPLSSGL